MSPPTEAALLQRLRAWLRGHRRVAWLAGALGLVLVVRAALPLVLEAVVESQGAAALGRELRVGDVDLALLSGGVELSDLAVGPPLGVAAGDSRPSQLQVGRIAADLSWTALLTGKLRLESVEVVAPRWLRLREQGRVLPLILATEEEPSEAESREEDAGLPVLRVDRVRLSDADVLFVDLADRARPPLAFHLGELALDGLALDRDEIVLADLSVRDPALRLLRGIDLAAFAGPAGDEPEAAPEPEAEPAEETEPEEAREPTRLRLRELSLEGARFTLVTPDGEEIEARITLEARDVGLDAGTRFPVELHLEIGSGRVDLTGELGLASPAFEGRLGWSALPLGPLARAAAPQGLSVTAGESSGELEVRIAAAEEGEEPSVHLSGPVRVTGLDAALAEPEAALAWSDLELAADEVAWADGRLSAELRRLRLDQPSLRLVRGAPEAERAAPPPADEPAAAAEPEPAAPPEPRPPPALSLAVLEVDDGRLEWRDETPSPAVDTKLRDVTLRGSQLRWPEASAEGLSVSVRGPGAARLSLRGALPQGSGAIEIALEDLALPPLSPYAREALGYEVAEGGAGLSGQVAVRGERIEVDTDLELHGLNVDGVEPGIFERRFGMSMDVALALLRGPGGTIDLPIRVAFERGESEVGLASVLVSGVRQALTGALASPVKGLGLVVNVARGGAGAPSLDFPPGAAAPAPEADERISQLVALLGRRPGLALTLHGSSGPEDAEPLAERILAERIEADQELPPVEAGLFQRRRLRGAVTARARGESPELDPEDRSALEDWVARVEVPRERFDALARERAAAVRDLLVESYGVDPERVATGETTSGEPRVEIELGAVAR